MSQYNPIKLRDVITIVMVHDLKLISGCFYLFPSALA
uniref:Uncharacterized protein n=1 Tax=Moniliophthora roreri TaxID=221103 RepID=A0A0W0FYA7_MONRR